MTALRVALVGTKNTGKTTFARTLEEYYGFTRLAFADPIKLSLVRAVNTFLEDQGLVGTITLADLNKDKDAFRLGMQWLGTEIVRDLCHRPDHWVKNLLARLDAIEANAHDEGRIPAIVVDDVRFENEADALRKRGFTLVRLVRLGPGVVDDHSSEKGIRFLKTDITLSLGMDPADTKEQARTYGYQILSLALRDLAGANPIAESWVRRISSEPAQQIQQELRQSGGVSGIENLGRRACAG